MYLNLNMKFKERHAHSHAQSGGNYKAIHMYPTKLLKCIMFNVHHNLEASMEMTRAVIGSCMWPIAPANNLRLVCVVPLHSLLRHSKQRLISEAEKSWRGGEKRQA